MCKRLEEGNPLAGLQFAIVFQNFGGERDPGSFPAPRKEVLAKFHEILRPHFSAGFCPAARTRNQLPAALGDRLQEIAQEILV